MEESLNIEVLHSSELTQSLRTTIWALCNRAYGEDLGHLFATFEDATHVLGYLDMTLVSHAMWVTRWLQPDNKPMLRTAYIEMVATDLDYMGRGFATAVMRRVGTAILDFDLGALCTGHPEFYARLGWAIWRGPLFIRVGQQPIPTPQERIMILLLPNSPDLDLDSPLSAEWREGDLW